MLLSFVNAFALIRFDLPNSPVGFRSGRSVFEGTDFLLVRGLQAADERHDQPLVIIGN
jgi:hypothetical protein